MTDYETLNHTKWECKYHVVFIPKYRRKVLYGELRKQIGEIFHALASSLAIIQPNPQGGFGHFHAS